MPDLFCKPSLFPHWCILNLECFFPPKQSFQFVVSYYNYGTRCWIALHFIWIRISYLCFILALLTHEYIFVFFYWEVVLGEVNCGILQKPKTFFKTLVTIIHIRMSWQFPISWFSSFGSSPFCVSFAVLCLSPLKILISVRLGVCHLWLLIYILIYIVGDCIW